MSKRLTDERLANICRAPWQDLDDVTNDEIVAMSDELKAARAQLAMMGPVYEAAELDREELVSLKHFYGNYPNGDRRFCVFCVKAKAVLERICDANDRSALSTPPDAKDDGNGE